MTTLSRVRPTTLGQKPVRAQPCIIGCTKGCFPAKGGLWAVGLALLAVGSGTATPMANPASTDAGAGNRLVTPSILGDDELLIDEVFQSHLPTTLEKDALRLSVHPHLGDYTRKDHLRLSTTLRYGLTENCEISMGSKLFFSHGNGDVRAFDGYGASNLRLGGKMDLGEIFFRGWITAIGVDYEFPVGRPPVELTDGLRHFRPYVTFSHRLESHPDVRLFVGFRFDAVTHTSLQGELGKNAFNSSSTGITGGLVIDRRNWHYTFEASVDTNRLIGHGDADVFTFRPGVLWEIPNRRHPERRSLWMVGVAVKGEYGPGGGSLGASFKLRYSRDLKNRPHRTPIVPGS